MMGHRKPMGAGCDSAVKETGAPLLLLSPSLMRKTRSLLAALALVAACAGTDSSTSTSGWTGFVSSFLDQYFAYRPDIAVSSGRHEFDGKLPDWSSDGINKFVAFLKDERAKALGLDSAKLDSAERFEREYLVARIDRDLWWLERADGPHKNPAYYTDALDPDPYLTRPYAPLDQRLKAFTGYARSVVTAAAQIRANLKGPLPRTFIDRAHGAFGGFADFFKTDVPTVFASVKDSALQRDFKQANDSAVAA